MPIDYQSDRPVYAQIADALRERIRSGDLSPGAKLPSQSELAQEFRQENGDPLTSQTIRRGLAVLQTEGLTEPHRGVGVFVRTTPPVLTVRMDRFSRAARAAGKGALAAEAEALGLEWRSEDLVTTETGVELVTVPAHIADVLGESRAAVKRRRMWVGGIPTQLADSYIPASIDAEIGYSTGATAPGGIYGLLEQHGHRLVRYREQLSGRQASPEESVQLHLSIGAPVIDLVRHAIDQDGRVVEYFDSTAVADTHRYVYEFEPTD